MALRSDRFYYPGRSIIGWSQICAVLPIPIVIATSNIMAQPDLGPGKMNYKFVLKKSG
jgi:hypothetical protein